MRTALIATLTFFAVSGQDGTPVSPALDDAAFWQLFVRLSEPDGYFEDENYVSNELRHQQVLPRLQEAIGPGGVYLGVGPEQNFTYIAALRPRLAFVIDIRRQNAMEHLMYKALFELSEDRAGFLSRLFSRPRPDGLGPDASSDDLFEAYDAIAPETELFEMNLTALLDLLVETHRFPLTPEDEASIRKVFNAFYYSGPEIMYVYQGTDERHPTYPALMRMTDASGKNWSYLGSEENFRIVRRMQIENRVVPVVGDFAGETAIRDVGEYVRSIGETIDVFYASNVEPYLFGSGEWEAFYDNVLTLPIDGSSLFVRTFFGGTARECRGVPIRTPVLSPMADFLAAYRNGEIAGQCALVERSR